MIRSARNLEPGLQYLEDFRPADPRLPVTIRWLDGVYRLFPGQIERPIADVERAETLASVLDGQLAPKLGFGIYEYTTVALAWLNHAVEMLSPGWPPRDLPSIGDDPSLSPCEIESARRLLYSTEPEVITSTESRLRALRWATRTPETLTYDPGSPQSTFGSALTVKLSGELFSQDARQSLITDDSGDVRWWLPPAFIPETWAYGVAELARLVVTAETTRNFTAAVAARVRRALWRFGRVLALPDDSAGPVVSANNTVQFILFPSPDRALLVQVFASLDGNSRRAPDRFMVEVIAEHYRDPANEGKDIPIPMPKGVAQLASDIEIVPLVVFAGPAHLIAPAIPGIATLALEDLIWISRSADADTDLYHFCRDLARSRDVSNPGAGVLVMGPTEEVDSSFAEVYGIKILDLITILRALAMWPVTLDRPIAEATRHEIIDHVANSTILGDRDAAVEYISTGLGLLELGTKEIQEADWTPWRIRRRRYRLLTRPLIRIDKYKLLVSPNYCLAASKAYLNYLSHGMLPWSYPTPPAPLRDALASYRDRQNIELENDVTRLLQTGGYKVRPRIKRDDAKSIGLMNLSGEIDDLALRTDSSVIWLIEVKDPFDSYSAEEIRRSLDRFYVGSSDKKAYVDLLAAKEADLLTDLDAVAASLIGSQFSDTREYTLRTIFVTRYPNVAAFVGGRYPFVVASDLLAYMRRTEDSSITAPPS